ncbi:MAG: tetraacyldisaccharide 4'-kinase [Bdellovibrionales bacterium]
MKTPRFWYPRPEDRFSTLKAWGLAPLSLFFRMGTFLRRVFASPYKAKVPVVCVGNVVAGGAGKTPTALALARILKDKRQKPVFVTRGTGGKGILTCVDMRTHKTADVGDEALLLAAVAPTWVCRDRAKAVREAETNGSVVIADDGLQNPNLVPTSSIVVVDADAGLGNGFIIPAGPLRETFESAMKRATAMILVGERDSQNLAMLTDVPVFRARLEPKLPLGFPRFGRFIAFAGLARPEKFFATARSMKLDIAGTREYPDHYAYKQEDIDALRLEAEEQGARLLTTEKDAVRLPPDFLAEVVVLPVQLIFTEPGAEKALADIILRSADHR